MLAEYKPPPSWPFLSPWRHPLTSVLPCSLTRAPRLWLVLRFLLLTSFTTPSYDACHQGLSVPPVQFLWALSPPLLPTATALTLTRFSASLPTLQWPPCLHPQAKSKLTFEALWDSGRDPPRHPSSSIQCLAHSPWNGSLPFSSQAPSFRPPSNIATSTACNHR